MDKSQENKRVGVALLIKIHRIKITSHFWKPVIALVIRWILCMKSFVSVNLNLWKLMSVGQLVNVLNCYIMVFSTTISTWPIFAKLIVRLLQSK